MAPVPADMMAMIVRVVVHHEMNGLNEYMFADITNTLIRNNGCVSEYLVTACCRSDLLLPSVQFAIGELHEPVMPDFIEMAVHNHSVETVDYLIGVGAVVSGTRLLHLAIESDCPIEIIQSLVDAGADCTHALSKLATTAAYHGDPDIIIGVLMAAGADPHAAGPDGQSAYAVAPGLRAFFDRHTRK